VYRQPPSQSDANAFVMTFFVAVSSKISSFVGGGSPMNSAEYLSNGFGGFRTGRIDETIIHPRKKGKILFCHELHK
jgi:hypothetical protein